MTRQKIRQFKAVSDGEISAIEISPLNNRLWYVKTSNGTFFYSKNGGTTWEQSFVLVPNLHYLYGSTMLASKIKWKYGLHGRQRLRRCSYLCIHRCAFASMRDSLPQTMVFELVANADEIILFAATEASPYVYMWWKPSGRVIKAFNA